MLGLQECTGMSSSDWLFLTIFCGRAQSGHIDLSLDAKALEILMSAPEVPSSKQAKAKT